MTKENVIIFIKDKLLELNAESKELLPNENFMDKGIIDSFDLLNLLSDIEEYTSYEVDLTQFVPSEYSSIDGLANIFTQKK